jgi:putative tricarboxylic transport membrane protein
MNQRELLGGLFWLAFSSIIVFSGSIRGNIGTVHYPGPGFMPFWAGVVLGFLALVVLATNARRKKGETGIRSLWTGKRWRNAFWITVSLFAYAVLLPWLGYLISTVGLMGLMFSLGGRQRWLLQGTGALATSAVTYLLFHNWFEVQLPKGIFGF